MTEFILHVAGSFDPVTVSEMHGQTAAPAEQNSDWYDDSDSWSDALDDDGR